MPRPLLGLLLGGALGLMDGLSGYLYPELAPIMTTVILYSTLKGFVSGTIIGLVARKVNSLPLGIVSGLTVGVLCSYVVTMTADAKLFWDIMLPGALLGLIVGFATQRFGAREAQAK
ncbi:MAG TPA: hypothetical protein VLE48_09810 [Terriglobales bacterium]|nr:hypothetical protein [Terriglobales bacterium]